MYTNMDQLKVATDKPKTIGVDHSMQDPAVVIVMNDSVQFLKSRIAAVEQELQQERKARQALQQEIDHAERVT